MSDPLAQFQWHNPFAELEKWEDLEKKALDKEYNENDWSGFVEWKKTWGWLPYGNFDLNEKIKEDGVGEKQAELSSDSIDYTKETSENESEEIWELLDKSSLNESNEKIDIEKNKENPNYPIIERFSEIDWINIDNNQIDSIIKALEKYENMDLLKDFDNIASEIEIDDKKLIDTLGLFISQIKKPKLDQETSEKQFEIPEDFESSSYDFLKKKENHTVQLLIENYTSFPDWNEWKPNFEKDLETTFKIAFNKTIKWKHFARSESFEIAKNYILNWDIEDKFIALEYINSLVNTKEWAKAKKTNNLYIKWKIKKLEEKLKKIDENDDFHKNNKEKQKEKAKINIELSKLKEIEIKQNEDKIESEVFAWDSKIEWWELDNKKEEPIPDPFWLSQN